MLLYDESLGYGYLVERDVGDAPRHRTGKRRTTSGGEIVPESIQYSPNGSKIAYLRRTFPGEFNMFLLPSRGVEQNGQRIAMGLTSEVFAFSPDGQRVAVLMRGPGFDTPEICLFDVSFREVVARFGPGTLSREAWHPSGRYFTFVAETLEAPQSYLVQPSRQLYAALAEAPYTMKQVTYVNKGVSGSYALSRDGRWVAAIIGGARVPGLLLFELGAFGVEFGTGTM